MPFRDDGEAARARIEQLEAELCRVRPVLEVEERCHAETARLRAALCRAVAERDRLGEERPWALRTCRGVLGVLTIALVALAAMTAAASTCRVAERVSAQRAVVSSVRLHACEESRHAAVRELDDARGHARERELVVAAAVPASPPSHGTLVRARVVGARGSSWAEDGDECLLAVAFASFAGPCAASLHCPGRERARPAVSCYVGDARGSGAPQLLHVRPAVGEAFQLTFDRTAGRVVIRADPSESAVTANVVAITPFEMP
jgi:hypothetical protein